ncbi:mitochondrial ribosomal large subunit component [Chytridiales sp. JEL 0842]|nr:mitochondrial ribosomal large subunit component [Chytridiales sp. JEL 0842]
MFTGLIKRSVANAATASRSASSSSSSLRLILSASSARTQHRSTTLKPAFSSTRSFSTLFNTTIQQHRLISPLQHSTKPTPINFQQSRSVTYTGLRPRRLKFRKAQKGFFKVKSGGSLRGTTLLHGNYGIRVTEGGRLKDSQIDAARTVIRRALKEEKGSKFYIRAFPARPVTAKPAQTRMGKGKGAVEYYAVWVSKGKLVFEVKCTRKDLALKALKVASAALPLKTEVIELKEGEVLGEVERAPRCLPHFLRKRFEKAEYKEKLEEVDARSKVALA